MRQDNPKKLAKEIKTYLGIASRRQKLAETLRRRNLNFRPGQDSISTLLRNATMDIEAARHILRTVDRPTQNLTLGFLQPHEVQFLIQGLAYMMPNKPSPGESRCLDTLQGCRNELDNLIQQYAQLRNDYRQNNISPPDALQEAQRLRQEVARQARQLQTNGAELERLREINDDLNAFKNELVTFIRRVQAQIIPEDQQEFSNIQSRYLGY